MTNTRLRPSVLSTLKDLQIDDDMAPDAQVHSSDDEDIGNAHIPKNNWVSALVSTDSPPPEDLLLAQTGDMAMFMDWFYKRQGITKLKPQDLEGLSFELVKVFHPNVIHLQYQMEECHKLLTDSVYDSFIRHNVSKPLPLGGPPGLVTIQSDCFFNKDLEYLRYGSKGSRPALSISKMKAAYYPDVGLEQMVPHQMWIDEECKYDIAAIAVRTHIQILSVVRIEVFSMYGYNYMKKAVLRRADLNEHIIVKRDFKYLYPNEFKDLHLVIKQRVEGFQLGIKSYQTQLNLTKPRWDATGFKYKHDYMVINSPRAVIFWDKYGVHMIMRFNKIHKFSDGTLHQTDEALDYRVKEFKEKSENKGRVPTEMELELEHTQQEHPSNMQVFTVKMEILLEPTSNKLLVAQWSESSRSITSSSDTEIAALKAEMAKINKNLMRVLQVNQQVKAVTPNYESCGGPHSFFDCPATVGNTQNVYAAGAYKGNNQRRNQFFLGVNQGQNQPSAYQAPAYQASVHQPQIPQPQLERDTKATRDMMHPTNNESTEDVQPPVVSNESLIRNSEPVNSPIIKPVASQKLPEKLGDPDKFLIPCDFPGMAECLALADLDASINLMPLSVWNKLSLPDLSPRYMTLELADRLISHPGRVAEDVFVKVGTFYFSADFVVLDFDADTRVPLILGRSFLKIGRALIDVFEGELTFRVGKEAMTFNLDQTSRYSANYNDMTADRIDVIDMACEEYSQEVVSFSDVIASGNPTPYVKPA
nr:reverse transcriptase domain-containing protein [Tanacetum cinerariifolium]